jgi:hypothetical protein
MTTRWRMEAVLVNTSTLNQMKHSWLQGIISIEI